MPKITTIHQLKQASRIMKQHYDNNTPLEHLIQQLKSKFGDEDTLKLMHIYDHYLNSIIAKHDGKPPPKLLNFKLWLQRLEKSQ